ncbi:MAG: peptide-methionine (S)-S-oxide reductase [Candidatus Heimdallarchaeota archaeon]|nr:peptide-methionine (S)-S-oxide reductase [Candidatus Heimdallarchaeota archaeon]
MGMLEITTLAGGCFWCLDAVFRQVNGIESIESGYTGGSTKNPTYEEVCSGKTGHAEVVQITFNPDIISFSQILEIFFSIHDPTQLNQQGPDIGTQYRSEIFYHTPIQKTIAEKIIRELNDLKSWDNPIVTKLSPIKDFYPAEDYHQDYYNENKTQTYCRVMISPKLNKFQKSFHTLIKNSPQ